MATGSLNLATAPVEEETRPHDTVSINLDKGISVIHCCFFPQKRWSVFQSMVTSIPTRALGGSEWVINYISSQCAPLKERMATLEGWRVRMQGELREQISNLRNQQHTLRLYLDRFRVRIGVVEKEVENKTDKTDNEKMEDQLRELRREMEKQMKDMRNQIEALEQRMVKVENDVALIKLQHSVPD